MATGDTITLHRPGRIVSSAEVEVAAALAQEYDYAPILGVDESLRACWDEQTKGWDKDCGGGERVGVIAPSKSGRINAAVTKPFVEFLKSKGFKAELLEPESQELLVKEVMDDGRFASLVVLPVSAGSAAKLAAIITDGKARKVRGEDSGSPSVPTYITIPVDMANEPGFVASTFVQPYAALIPDAPRGYMSAYPYLYLDSFKLAGEADREKHDLFWQYADLGRAFLDRRDSVMKVLTVLEESRLRSQTQKVEIADEVNRVAGGAADGGQVVNVKGNYYEGDDYSRSARQGDGGSIAMGDGDAISKSINVSGAEATSELIRALESWASGNREGKDRVRELLEGEIVLNDQEAKEMTAAVANYLGGGKLSESKIRRFGKWAASLGKSATEKTVATAVEAAIKGYLN